MLQKSRYISDLPMESMDVQSTQQPLTRVCLLVNGKSGSHCGRTIIKKGVAGNGSIDIHVFDILQLLHRETELGDTDAYAELIKLCSKPSNQTGSNSTSDHLDNETVVVAAGGDGTVTLAMDILERLKITSPLAILPIGTGNELSRVTGWGQHAGYKYLSSEFFSDILTAKRNQLDRWDVTLSSGKEEESITRNITMSCFLSIGFDAKIAHHFHLRRAKSPSLCDNRELNKFWHVVYGAREFLRRTTRLSSVVKLWVDGVETDLGSKTGSLQIFNIHSAADGVDFWGTGKQASKHDILKSEQASQPSYSDGVLEVCSTNGVVDLLSSRMKVGHSSRLAQGKEIVFETLVELPIQVDGEPWILPPSRIVIRHKSVITLVSGPNPTKCA